MSSLFAITLGGGFLMLSMYINYNWLTITVHLSLNEKITLRKAILTASLVGLSLTTIGVMGLL